MVDFSKPTKIPRWADTGVTVEPSEAKKDAGWVAPELPPDTYFNWYQNLVGLWVKWIDERTFDNGSSENFQIKSPAGATNGGTLTLEGGDPAVVTGDGGAVTVTGADGGATSGEGGGLTLSGGDGDVGGSATLIGGTGTASGGDSLVRAGSGPDFGGLAELFGGDSEDVPGTVEVRGGDASVGSNKGGGNALIGGGNSTGSGSSKVEIYAAVGAGSGTTVRTQELFVTFDGAAEEIAAIKHVRLDMDVNTLDDGLTVEGPTGSTTWDSAINVDFAGCSDQASGFDPVVGILGPNTAGGTLASQLLVVRGRSTLGTGLDMVEFSSSSHGADVTTLRLTVGPQPSSGAFRITSNNTTGVGPLMKVENQSTSATNPMVVFEGDGLPTGAGSVLFVDASAASSGAIETARNGTRADIRLDNVAGDPSSLADGDIWYNSTTNKFRGRAGGASVDFH